jgi:hypothetical protein
MHTIILGIIICIFIYFGFHTQYESFSIKGKGHLNIDEISRTNDISFGLVEFSLVPFSSTSQTVTIGLEKNPKNVSFPLARTINSQSLFPASIVGIKVPDGIRVTIFELPNQGGYFNAIVGPNLIDTLETAKNLQYPEAEDDAGNLLANNFGGKGWQNRVNSFVIHRYKEIPEEFDGVFYTQKYGINDYEKYKQMGGDLTNLADKTRESQWQHYLDIGESLGYAINQSEVYA